MQYRVNSYFGRGASHPCALFKDLSDAGLFIEQKLKVDARLKLDVTYRIYEFDDLVKEYPPIKDGMGALDAEQPTGTQGQGNGAAFRPTPFNMAPKPPGVPPKWNSFPEADDDAEHKS